MIYALINHWKCPVVSAKNVVVIVIRISASHASQKLPICAVLAENISIFLHSLAQIPLLTALVQIVGQLSHNSIGSNLLSKSVESAALNSITKIKVIILSLFSFLCFLCFFCFFLFFVFFFFVLFYVLFLLFSFSLSLFYVLFLLFSFSLFYVFFVVFVIFFVL